MHVSVPLSLSARPRIANLLSLYYFIIPKAKATSLKFPYFKFLTSSQGTRDCNPIEGYKNIITFRSIPLKVSGVFDIAPYTMSSRYHDGSVWRHKLAFILRSRNSIFFHHIWHHHHLFDALRREFFILFCKLDLDIGVSCYMMWWRKMYEKPYKNVGKSDELLTLDKVNFRIMKRVTSLSLIICSVKSRWKIFRIHSNNLSVRFPF